ncbi:DUF305 domain-containing protein [Sanguibacter sp. 25GB23B1]|uniref:DUF305 domain-containing protein n=1 Tax=unclassified Sanguibacter TaxID=2645534 RepID=UPI0032AF3254
MKTTRITAAAVSLALLGALAACADPAPDPTQAATTTTPAVAHDAPAPTHSDADTAFAQLMTVHHEGAIEMASLAETNAGSQEVRDVATTIADAQTPEIETMTWWLDSWGEDSATRASQNGMDHTGMQMDGLAHEEAMFELGGLTGPEFDKRFLELMVAHHEGAIVMAQEEIDGGVNEEAVALAESIIADQTAEIALMQGMLPPA